MSEAKPEPPTIIPLSGQQKNAELRKLKKQGATFYTSEQLERLRQFAPDIKVTTLQKVAALQKSKK
jgi:hypothetical protein